MKNADMPAMPQSATNEGHPCNYYDYGGPGVPTGLTKREMMAMNLAQGLLAGNATYGGKTDARHLLAADAVAHADALLAELDRTCQKP